MRKHRAKLLWIICGFIVYASPVTARMNSLMDKCGVQLANGLLEKASLRGKQIAVGEFLDSEKRVTGLSSLIAGRLEQELLRCASAGGFQLVDRKNIEELVKEWKLGMYGYVSSETSAQAGKLLGINALCVGNFTCAGKSISVRANLLNAETE